MLTAPNAQPIASTRDFLPRALIFLSRWSPEETASIPLLLTAGLIGGIGVNVISAHRKLYPSWLVQGPQTGRGRRPHTTQRRERRESAEAHQEGNTSPKPCSGQCALRSSARR